MGLFSRKSTKSEPYVLIWRLEYAYDVVGESNYRGALTGIAAGGSSEDQARGEVYRIAVLEREPSNKYDRNAVRVTIDGHTVGYLPREDAPKFGPAIGQVELSGGRFAVRAVVGWSGPVDGAPIGVRLDMPDPAKGNRDVTFTPLSAIEGDTAPRATAKASPKRAPASSAAKPSVPATPTVAARRKLAEKVAKAEDGTITPKAAESLQMLVDEFVEACQEVLEEAELDLPAARDVLTAYGFTTERLDLSSVPREWLNDVSNQAESLSDALSELVDEWSDSDRDDREGMRDNVSDEAGQLLYEFASAAGATTTPAAALPPPSWYPDPDVPGQLRYWDGGAWTEHRHTP